MLQLAVLGSGSSGNSALVCHEDTRILIDAGLSARQLCLRLREIGVDPDSLDAIVLTHEHGDHTRGIDVFCRQRRLPIYATTHTCAVLREGVQSGVIWKQFEAGHGFQIEGIQIDSFSVPHDAIDPVGFLFQCGRSSLGVLSDVGHVTRMIVDRLKGVDTLFTEANYDEILLQNDSKRPWATKQRISNRHGHLSNEQTAALVGEIAGPNLTRVVLGHLSSDCNTPELAAGVVAERLRHDGHAGVTVECAGRDAILPLLPVVDEDLYRTRFSEEIPAKSARVCESGGAAAHTPAPPVVEWNQTEWAF
ncbi:MAG: MBL fold metallo-hydrolase [Verrucomicrobiaceae bacterium]|nr:MBL fold metallo-hydrolase [Verrucomicrobiaceae bacterium]